MKRMGIREIREMPTTTGQMFGKFMEHVDPEKCHESLFRSWHILDRAKWLLQNGCPANVVLQEIAEMEEK